jgi:small subunit ribosomal protein S6
MKTNHYESVIIINAALEDEQVEATISRVQEQLTTNGGNILELEKWGRKRLAYPIQKAKSGYYVVIRFDAPSDLIAKIERIYKLDETIVRYLTVLLSNYDLEQIKKEKEMLAKRAAETKEAAAEETES